GISSIPSRPANPFCTAWQISCPCYGYRRGPDQAMVPGRHLPARTICRIVPAPSTRAFCERSENGDRRPARIWATKRRSPPWTRSGNSRLRPALYRCDLTLPGADLFQAFGAHVVLCDSFGFEKNSQTTDCGICDLYQRPLARGLPICGRYSSSRGSIPCMNACRKWTTRGKTSALSASLLHCAIIPIAISEMPINLREIKNHYMKYREDLCR
ncbi:MAG TPA: hypothetical protein VN229_12920, partial [Terriglobales bacterium]|nr:hypothetical protein [Terriglobales bacterium]